MNTKLEQALTRAVKKVPGNRGAARVLLMDALQREFQLEDEALMTSVAVVLDQVVEEGIHLDNLEAFKAEVIRRARRAHLRVIK
jgi:L-serine deaminase